MRTRSRPVVRLLPAVLLVVVALGLWGCESPVTSGGKHVTDPALIAATRTAAAIEAQHVALGDWLITRHRTACLPAPPSALVCAEATQALTINATQYAPAVLKALLALKEALTQATQVPPTRTPAQVVQVGEALTQAHQQALTWAEAQGWKPTP